MAIAESRLTNSPVPSQGLSVWADEFVTYQWLTQTVAIFPFTTSFPQNSYPLIQIVDEVDIWGCGYKYLFSGHKISKRMVEKEIDIDKLKMATSAPDEEVYHWVGSLLEDYDIQPTPETVEDTLHLLKMWVARQAAKTGITLKEDDLSKLTKFSARLAYEALYVGPL